MEDSPSNGGWMRVVAYAHDLDDVPELCVKLCEEVDESDEGNANKNRGHNQVGPDLNEK